MSFADDFLTDIDPRTWNQPAGSGNGILPRLYFLADDQEQRARPALLSSMPQCPHGVRLGPRTGLGYPDLEGVLAAAETSTTNRPTENRWSAQPNNNTSTTEVPSRAALRIVLLPARQSEVGGIATLADVPPPNTDWLGARQGHAHIGLTRGQHDSRDLGVGCRRVPAAQ